MSLGTLTFERKELSENEMIYGLTILKFVEKNRNLCNPFQPMERAYLKISNNFFEKY